MPSRRRAMFTGVRWPSYKGRYTPLRSQTNPERPLKLNQRDLVRAGATRQDLWWQTIHRKGPRRKNEGGDPLELRAIPKWQRRGTLPERIILKYLLEVLRMVENIDFDFQSSLAGGRLELGGIVADFLFPYMKIVLNPAGPTHEGFQRSRLDEEQRQQLAEMGYTMYLFDDDMVYNEYVFEEMMRSIFDLLPSTGSSAFGGMTTDNNTLNESDLLWIMQKGQAIRNDLNWSAAEIQR